MDKLKTSVEITRADDRGGEIATAIEYLPGMPSVLNITQTVCGQTAKISLVGRECGIFVRAMNEFKYLRDVWEDKDDD